MSNYFLSCVNLRLLCLLFLVGKLHFPLTFWDQAFPDVSFSLGESRGFMFCFVFCFVLPWCPFHGMFPSPLPTFLFLQTGIFCANNNFQLLTLPAPCPCGSKAPSALCVYVVSPLRSPHNTPFRFKSVPCVPYVHILWASLRAASSKEADWSSPVPFTPLLK